MLKFTDRAAINIGRRREGCCEGRRGRVHGKRDESLTETLRGRENQNRDSNGSGAESEVVSMFTTEELQAIDRKYFTVIVADGCDFDQQQHKTRLVYPQCGTCRWFFRNCPFYVST